MRLLYLMFEFQPIAHAVPTGGSPRVERRGQIHEKSKVNNEISVAIRWTSGKMEDSSYAVPIGITGPPFWICGRMETSMISVDRFTKSAQEVAQRAAEIMQRYQPSPNRYGTPAPCINGTAARWHISTPGIPKSRRKRPLRRAGYDPTQPAPKAISLRSEQDRYPSQRVWHEFSIWPMSSPQRLKDEHISTEHIFLEILSEHNTPAARLLEGTGLTRDRVYDAIQQMRG